MLDVGGWRLVKAETSLCISTSINLASVIKNIFESLGNFQIEGTTSNFQPPTSNMSLVKLAEHPNELPFTLNNIAVVEVAGKKLCIGRHRDQFFGFAFKCPHAGGNLSEGHIDALGNVVCPLHRYKFSMANGRNTSGEGYFLKHWPVEWREDGVYIDMDKEPGSGLFFS